MRKNSKIAKKNPKVLKKTLKKIIISAVFIYENIKKNVFFSYLGLIRIF
tara:strand:- start:27 stop:173 length:147 start_codon:yes stop_codon:yes gene_type:complete